MLHKLRRFNFLSLLVMLLLGLFVSLGVDPAVVGAASYSSTGSSGTQTQSVTGKVTARTDAAFTLEIGKLHPSLKVTADTKFFQAGKAVTYAALKIDMQVTVSIRFMGEGQGYAAVSVTLPTVQPSRSFTGQVTAKGTDSFTLISGSQSTTFRVTANTRIYGPGVKVSSLTDMKVGMRAEVVAKANNTGSYDAVTVVLSKDSPRA